MAEQTNIEWCDSTFNPWIGCTRVSPACDHCYAAVSTAARSLGVRWWHGEARHRTSAFTWRQPLKWERNHPEFFAEHGRRRRVFCASLADVFDNEVDPEWRRDLFRLISDTPHLDWLLLTKRIGNVDGMCPNGLPTNVWLGATVCNQDELDRDLPKLMAVAFGGAANEVANIFLSIEPLLGPISFDAILADQDQKCDETKALEVLDWIIVGGESGPHARPMNPDWVRSLRNQCVAAKTPFLFKQWGEWAPDCLCPKDHVCTETKRPEPGKPGVMFRCGKKNAGRTLDGREWNEFPRLYEA